MSETKLEMAERHVREGEVHVERQRQIVAGLRRDGHPTGMSEALLQTLEDSLQNHRFGLAQILSEH